MSPSVILPAKSFRSIAQMFETMRDAPGFAPTVLMASTSEWARIEAGGLARMIHCGPGCSFSAVSAHGPPRSSWVRQMTMKLTHAGYGRTWRLADETGFRRWLPQRRKRTEELGFLRDLGEDGSPETWPERAMTLEPVRPRSWNGHDWATALGDVRTAGIAWSGLIADFGRREALSQTGLPGWMLEVSAASSVVDARPRVFVRVRVFDPTEHARKVPRGLARSLNQELLRGGYRRGEVFASKNVRDAASAAREGVRVFERLKEVTGLS